VGAELANPDELVSRIAARQHGVISLDQLEHAGVKRRGVSLRVQAGRLHRLHRGVYAVGHPGLSREGRWLAAVLACGPAAVLSHITAAALWNLLPVPGVIHVTVPGQSGRARRAGIRVHRSTTLDESLVTRRTGIPVTTPPRTLVDLRGSVTPALFASALRQAELRGLPLDPSIETDRTRSELEARFLALCRRHRLPAPKPNVRVGPFVVDFLWPEAKLIDELDGYRFHRGRSAFETDRARDMDLKLLGYEVIRLTWRQLADDPAQIELTLRTLLQRRVPPPTRR
jgi:very-short-patch-repair endonuclease